MSNDKAGAEKHIIWLKQEFAAQNIWIYSFSHVKTQCAPKMNLLIHWQLFGLLTVTLRLWLIICGFYSLVLFVFLMFVIFYFFIMSISRHFSSNIFMIIILFLFNEKIIITLFGWIFYLFLIITFTYYCIKSILAGQ